MWVRAQGPGQGTASKLKECDTVRRFKRSLLNGEEESYFLLTL